ncbi:MAG: hypothetical protein ACLFPJ_02640 [Candidatus Woesearchaeota archaeon]
MKMRNILSIFLFLLVGLVAMNVASAVPATIDWVKVNGDTLDPSNTNSIYAMDRNNELDITVQVTATADVKNVQIEGVLRGYDFDDQIQDLTRVRDMTENRTYRESLKLDLPTRMDKDLYKLRIRVEDRYGDTTQLTYDLEIENQRHDVQILDVVFSPSNEVISGRALLSLMRIKNYGMIKQTDGVKVSVNIPDLGVTAAGYVDSLREDQAVTTEELYLRIPKCTPAGVYDAVFTLEYHAFTEKETVTKQIKVIEDETCVTDEEEESDKTVIAVGPTNQDVVIGDAGVIYPLTITNTGKTSKTYVVTAEGYENFGTVEVSPENIVVLDAGEAKALYVYVSAKEDATVGEQMFSLTIQSGSEKLKEMTLKANVVEGESDQKLDLRNLLLIGLLILVILLVILGLIIGFSKLKNNDREFDDDESESKETYY